MICFTFRNQTDDRLCAAQCWTLKLWLNFAKPTTTDWLQSSVYYFQKLTMGGKWTFHVTLIISMLCATSANNYRGEEKHDIGTLAGDVQNWAMLIQNYILQVSCLYFCFWWFFFLKSLVLYLYFVRMYHCNCMFLVLLLELGAGEGGGRAGRGVQVILILKGWDWLTERFG